MTTPLLSDSWSDSTTAETYANTTERPLESFSFYIASRYLGMVCRPLILLFGIFGNVMITIVMRRTTSDESTIHLYFIATSVFDMIYLCTITLELWMTSSFGLDLSATHTVVCKMFVWLATGSGTISCWCLVCMTAHRAMSVVWPHRVNLLCTRRTVLLLLTGIIAFFALLYSHQLIGFDRVFMAQENTYRCSLKYDNENYLNFFENIFLYVELSVYCLLPFIFLVVSNSVLVWKLSGSVKAVSRQLTQRDSEQLQSRKKAANSVTLTVVAVSMAFLVLTLPTSISFILNSLTVTQFRVSGNELAKRVFISNLLNFLSETNSAVNFYLYILTGRRFREEFINVMCCGRNRRRRGASSETGGVAKQSTLQSQSPASTVNTDMGLNKKGKITR